MKSINQKDLEAISAYIDQALDRKEQARLEARLKNEPALRAELNSMRRTRQILRSTPAMRAPRNFTLTPELVDAAARKQNRLLPVTRFAFVLASIFFVFALVGNYTLGNLAAPQTEQSMAMSAPADPAAVEEAAASDMIEESAAGATEMEAAAVQEEPVAEDIVSEEIAIESAGIEGTLEPAAESLQAMSPTEEALSIAAEPPAEEDDAADLARTMDAEESSAEGDAASEAPAEKVDLEEMEAAGAPWSIWMIAAAISGGLALASGGLLLALRRR